MPRLRDISSDMQIKVLLKRRMASLCIAGLLAAAAACLLAPVAASPPQRLPSFRFDMGTADSPVANGYIQVAPDTLAASRSYGWETGGAEGFDVPRPPENPAWKGPGGQVIPRDLLIASRHNAVTRDGVRSRADLVFRVTLPDGRYRVAITLGRLDRPVCSEQIEINGQLVARDVDAKHYARRGAADHQYGYPVTVRRTVEVRGGVMRIRVYGDDRGFRRRFLREFEKPVPHSYLVGKLSRARKPDRPDLSLWGAPSRRGRGRFGGRVWVRQDIGGPFTENAVMAIAVYPYVEPPLVWRDGKLAATVPDAPLRRAVRLFSEGRFADAEKAFGEVADPYSRALGYLWLAGRPEYEEELRLVPKARALLERLAVQRPDDLMLAEQLEVARRMEKALHRFVHRADQGRTYNELLMVTGEVSSIQPDDPVYYKALIYAGRSLFMVDPHRWVFVSGTGRRIFERLEKAGFGDNRYVRWYLHDEWSSRWPDWRFPDYAAQARGVPGWAAAVFEAYNRELDLCEWWLEHRQRADGSLGGGWGDDVEILRSFGTFGAINTEASPRTIEGVRRLADGAWRSGMIDTEAGYFARVGDSEHTGEWTGDTLTAMIRIDYGNPVYVERALKTGKLMRDVWMGTNACGHFLMRSNFLGARGVGPPRTANDSRINGRPASPARAVLWYNNLPTLRELFLAWADAWLAAALSTAKGKPRGIIPQEIGFARSEIGGTGSPTWYTAAHPPGTVNYDWGGAGSYHDYIVDLFLLAYRVTGQRKYLEPLEAEAAYARRHCPPRILGSQAARQGRLTADLWRGLPAGSPQWIGARLAGWPAQWERVRRVFLPERFRERRDLWTYQQAESMAGQERDGARRRWPHVTTECIATDRVYWPGMGNALRLMTGFGTVGPWPLVTYRGLGRHFAALVLQADAAHLKVALCNVSPRPAQGAILPWVLQTHAEYQLGAGPDADLDGRIDRVSLARKVQLRTRGQQIRFPIPPKATYVVELTRTGRASGTPQLLPDLAICRRDIVVQRGGRLVEVTVHNIGSAAARGAAAALYVDDRPAGAPKSFDIEAPLDLEPKQVRLQFRLPAGASGKLTVRLDPEDRLQEITELNNSAFVQD